MPSDDAAHVSAHEYEVLSSERRFEGHVVAVRTDHVAMPGGGHAQRDVVEHPGAVGVVALDEAGRVLLVRQYRHPVGAHLWELPAGLRDVADEPPLDTAKRELLEEGGLRATSWHRLVDIHTSPGMTDELIRLYLARDLEHVAAEDRPEVHSEELELEDEWVPLDDACARVLSGDITNAACALGVLAAARLRDTAWAGLSPA